MSLIKRKSGNLFPYWEDDFDDNNFFGLGNFFGRSPYLRGSHNPPANITETKNEFRLDISAPGLTRADFKVEVDDGLLIISSEKKEESNDEKENYKRREFSYSSFSRSFQLPDNVKEDDINAKYDNGVLHVTIPKKEIAPSKPKKAIDVT
jgi:HSP20 family protein